eukprot:CAMPEP_0118943344 /NCGR_PEP_ID=MMETSP1169-20130426/38122_1 /TAXON_ID=36882 /ORGANISM="Pyramimonas obovata, Strain CCMP722" /LENGTH=178 /DNA_ID=CAMNT_0006888581 /DNA_START=70 /DNA_END=603 /DNA_ORIENTATION=+
MWLSMATGSRIVQMPRSIVRVLCASRPLVGKPDSHAYTTEAKGDNTGELKDLREAFGYCAAQVRRYDYEGYLCTLQLPTHLRPAAFAIRAFNVETVQAVESTNEASIAKMRLLFWRDAVKGIYQGKPPQQPVAQALSKVVEVARPTKRWFDRIVDTRSEDLDRTAPPPNLAAVEAYAE